MRRMPDGGRARSNVVDRARGRLGPTRVAQNAVAKIERRHHATGIGTRQLGEEIEVAHQHRGQHDAFDTRGEPNGGYVVNVQWAMRLTWGGEFIHSAPWSTGAQGRYNVSHGCVNLAPRNAKWLFDITHVGDPVIVKGTERTLIHGNGWTAWDRPWSEYVKGSALPVPAELASAPAVDHITGAPPPPAPPPTQTAAPSAEPAAQPTD